MVQFTQELDDVRSYDHPIDPVDDKSGLYLAKGLQSGITSLEGIGESIDASDKAEAIGGLGKELTDLESELGPQAQGIKQNPSQRGEYVTRAQAINRKYITLYPHLAKEISQTSNDVLGLNVGKEIYEQAFHDQATAQAQQDSAESSAITDSVKGGYAVYGQDGQIDRETTLSNHQSIAYTSTQLELSKRKYDLNKITKEEHDNNTKLAITQTIDVAGKAMLHNLLTGGVNYNGKVLPISDLIQMGDPKAKAILEQTIDQQSGIYKTSLNTALSKSGLLPDAIKELQALADTNTKDMKTMLMSGSIDDLKTLEAQNKLFDAQANMDFNQTTRNLARTRAVLGQQAFGAQTSLLDPRFQKQAADGWSAFFADKGQDVPAIYTDKTAALQINIHNTVQTAQDPEHLVNTAPEQVQAVSHIIIKGLRDIEKNPNNMDEKSDKVFLNYTHNLALYGKTKGQDNQDGQTITNEIANPLWLQTYKAVKQRQKDVDKIANTGAQVVGFLDSRLDAMDKAIPAKYEDTILGPGEVTGYARAGVDAEGNVTKGSATTEAPLAKLQFNADNGKFYVDTNMPRTSPGNGALDPKHQDWIANKQRYNQLLVDVNSLNKTVDTMVGLKDEAGYGGMSDMGYRMKVVSSLPNFGRLLPQDAIPTETTKATQTEQPKGSDANPIVVPVVKGLVERGNIDNLYNRPELQNKDGTYSTTLSKSFNLDGKETLLPTVVDGKKLTDQEAVDRYKQTGEHLGKFDTPENADAFATKLHNEQAARRDQQSSSENPYDKIFQMALDSPGNQEAPAGAPLSVKNNNPGNIRPQGATTGFLKFSSKEDGMKAMAQDLAVKINGRSQAMMDKFGQRYAPTIAHLIATWAPASENDTEGYTKKVAKLLGKLPTELLSVEDIPALQQAMIEVEGGKKALKYFYS